MYITKHWCITSCIFFNFSMILLPFLVWNFLILYVAACAMAVVGVIVVRVHPYKRSVFLEIRKSGLITAIGVWFHDQITQFRSFKVTYQSQNIHFVYI